MTELTKLYRRARFWADISFRMLRYRTVILMITFEAIGFQAVQPARNFSFDFILVALMLGTLYMSSTCFNDISDEEVDKINLKNDPSRPLVVTGTTPRQLRQLGVASILAASLAAVLVSPYYLGFVLAGVVLGMAYSLPPLRLSYRGILASLWLPLSYVVLPFLAGAWLQGRLDSHSVYILMTMYICFVGRILLKDFRDYKGDKKVGKLNFLVRHGPRATCQAAAAAWLLGDALFVLTLHHSLPLLTVLMQPLIAMILYFLYRLSIEPDFKRQLLDVMVIGRCGNAITVGLLTSLLLQSFDYSVLLQNFLILIVTGLVLVTAILIWHDALLKPIAVTGKLR